MLLRYESSTAKQRSKKMNSLVKQTGYKVLGIKTDGSILRGTWRYFSTIRNTNLSEATNVSSEFFVTALEMLKKGYIERSNFGGMCRQTNGIYEWPA